MLSMSDRAYQQCISPKCESRFDLSEVLFACPNCHSLLDVRYDWPQCAIPKSLTFFDDRVRSADSISTGDPYASGVWRFHELLPFAEVDELVTLGEGQTRLQRADELARQIGLKPNKLFLQYEGFNPSGSFKDNGMAAAFTIAKKFGRSRVACASTGNTSASLSLYAAHTKTKSGQPMQAIVFVGGGKIAFGKLAQALDRGATTIQIAGDFDSCMSLIQQAAQRLDLYVMNSINPFRLEGQKTIMYRVLQALQWNVPDWIIVPGGNLGNTSAFGKAFMELKELGLIDRMPQLAVINAAGANALFELYERQKLRYNNGQYDQQTVDSFFADRQQAGYSANTIASAIEIAQPVNLPKALRSLDALDGVVRQVSDDDIMDGKALVGRYGFGCEPASGAAVAGLKLLREEGVISSDDRIVCILTGHELKDAEATVSYHQSSSSQQANTFANAPICAAPDVAEIARILNSTN